ncbi:glycine--tRNA ligase subunit beta [Helicobacter aurati]|uniref:Glycine--tRNA ligase beta subunit n=1 Tax=Helicobacter aurati TaxID=137778 RepID=A0A3D8J961_9HELI|nr:glycine--tRNA ligase subunit beta [Helicobacter aurati]RDU73381.1 glycine--tRNA ligase subunit beta [Helicobacter aurati]
MAELLIEILTEELPAIPLLKNFHSFQEQWRTILKQYRLETDFTFYYTPRRLVLLHRDFACKQADSHLALYGPPVQIAYNDDKTLSRALLSFLAKNQLTQEQLTTTIKDNKEVVYVEQTIQGTESTKILADMVIAWLESLHFGKTMRWGNYHQTFIRPIRNICILFDGQLIPCEAYGIKSSNIITPHRQAKIATKTSYNTENTQVNLQATGIDSYLDILQNHGVIVNQNEREKIILESLYAIEQKHNVDIEIDKQLLAEIVAITEYPTAMLGHFDEKFLEIPKEMIIASMKENQRYFAVYQQNKHGDSNKSFANLYAGFVVVSNAFQGNFDLILKGNEKVLRARLEDALFFYHNDKKANMNFGSLENIGFIEGAGNLQDKVLREINLVKKVFHFLQNPNVNQHNELSLLVDQQESVIKTLHYAKNDLLSQSVGEFPELQGIMGANFAALIGLNENECLGIKEQYLPHGQDSALPSTAFSAIVNLVIKLDTVFSLFNLNKIPTGSKDPFALRRQTTAILKICAKFNCNFRIYDICNLALHDKNYQHIDHKTFHSFIIERVYGIFSEINPSIVRAVLELDINIGETFHRIVALARYCDGVDLKAITATFKRVANIVQNPQDISQQEINPHLFEESEKKLYANLSIYQQQKRQKVLHSIHNDFSPKSQDFLNEAYIASLMQQLESLFGLKEYLDKVFDDVLIYCDDRTLRTNRIALVVCVFHEFLEFGDMRQITA